MHTREGVQGVGLLRAEEADIPRAKLVDYLLSQTHPSGRSKAAFFAKHGFSRDNWQELSHALRLHAMRGEVVHVESTHHGVRHVVDGALAAPDGTSLKVRSVWFIRTGESVPTFATAHPLRRTHDPRT